MDKVRIKSIFNCELCKNKPCLIGCPLDNDIPSAISKLFKEDYEASYRIFNKTSFLVPVCGRVCPHSKQCEGSCIKRGTKNLVKIGEIEKSVGDEAIKNGWITLAPKNPKYNVAVIGSGPASLACAAFLRVNGIGVTIYEKHDYLGGLLSHGIPDFRLPKKVVDATVNNIINMGIEVKYNTELGKDITLNTLKRRHDAVFIGIGANVSNKMHIEGEKLNGVYGANEYLEKKLDINFKEKVVVVSGGGDVAMDTARTIKRLGANKVIIAYRRGEDKMPSDDDEIAAAKKEGIKFMFNTNIIKITGRKKVTGVEVVKTKNENKKGKSSIKNIEGTNKKIECNYVMMAIGSHPDSVVRKLRLSIDGKSKIIIDKDGKTNDKKVFAGGDVAGIKSTVAWAHRSGRNAAYAIIEYLNNE